MLEKRVKERETVRGRESVCVMEMDREGQREED